ncbi:MAG: acyltransferase [Oceanospirillales bacterium]|nr:acyltransferase [Oceanospirillales bacterium]
MTNPARPLSGQIASLDGLRAFSVLIVFIAHAGFGDVIPGGFGVTVFFLISGFLITTLLFREFDLTRDISISAFYTRRALRILPPMLFALVLSMSAVQVGAVAGGYEIGTVMSQIFFYTNYLFIYGSETNQWLPGTTVLWSLAVEEHYYIIFPWFFILVAKGSVRSWHLAMACFAFLMVRCAEYFVFGFTPDEIYHSSETRMDSILFGALLAMMWRDGILEKIFSGKRAMLLALSISVMLLLLSFLYRDVAFRSTLRYSLQGLALIPIFYYAVTLPQNPLFAILNWKPVMEIGVLSYSIYLVHGVVLAVLIENEFADNASLTLLLGGFSASVGLAFFIKYFVEKPIYKLRKRFREAAA